jgi:hypothetical protein
VQRHQLLHLPDQFWSLIPGHHLVWNIPDVTQRITIGLFVNIKPLLVLISEGGVLGIVKVLLLHPISKGQVRSTGNFGAALDPFFLKQNRYRKRSKWGWILPYAS